MQEIASSAVRDRNVRVMLDLFRAIEERDPNDRNLERELSFYQPDVEFRWPPALPYGGTFRGRPRPTGSDWNATWSPLQPTAAERRMDPQVIGATDHQVVILYHQRGLSPRGRRFDGEVIGLYELREFRLARAQMFYYDEAACVEFLERAAAETRFSCNLNALSVQEQDERARLTGELGRSVLKKVELNDGYAVQIDIHEFAAKDLARWSELERRCCPFVDIGVEQHPATGVMILRLTGSAGVKQFIESELDGLTPRSE